MAAQLVQIEKGDRRASVVESTLSVWVARGWKLVTESDSQPEAEADGEETAQAEAEEVDAGQQPEDDKPADDKPVPVAPVAKPAGAHQAPEPPTRS